MADLLTPSRQDKRGEILSRRTRRTRRMTQKGSLALLIFPRVPRVLPTRQRPPNNLFTPAKNSCNLRLLCYISDAGLFFERLLARPVPAPGGVLGVNRRPAVRRKPFKKIGVHHGWTRINTDGSSFIRENPGNPWLRLFLCVSATLREMGCFALGWCSGISPSGKLSIRGVGPAGCAWLRLFAP
jgi:hypothetical protein